MNISLAWSFIEGLGVPAIVLTWSFLGLMIAGATQFLIYQGLLWIGYDDPKQKVARARGLLVSALLGLIVIYTLSAITLFVFGLNGRGLLSGIVAGFVLTATTAIIYIVARSVLRVVWSILMRARSTLMRVRWLKGRQTRWEGDRIAMGLIELAAIMAGSEHERYAEEFASNLLMVNGRMIRIRRLVMALSILFRAPWLWLEVDDSTDSEDDKSIWWQG